MKTSSARRDRLAVLVTLCGLLALGIVALLGGNGVFSGWERRYLADAPKAPSLTDWTFDKETEKYLADHVPFRQALVAADAAVNTATGRRTQLEAWPVCGAIVEQPVPGADAETAAKRIRRLDGFAEKAGAPWLLLTPPTHGWLLRDRMLPLMASLYEGETAAVEALAADPHAVRMPEAFARDPETVYYRTDHHWTLAGAYQAYLALGERLGYEPLPMEAFGQSSFDGFHGTTLSRSGLPPVMADRLDCAAPTAPVTLTVLDGEEPETYDHLIFPEAARTYDGYAVYLNGNHGLLTIENPQAPGGVLLVYKDSFANCLLPMLSAHYRWIIAADARYMSGGFTDALALARDRGGPDTILYVYSLDSLMHDTEIIRKISR